MSSTWGEKRGPKEDDFDDEGLPLLRRHTKVRVTGNNRTKGALVGLSGVVKKAVGLGGWHWLKLSNGAECRLQRNALSVISHPTGLELDSEEDEEGADASVAHHHGAAANGGGSGGRFTTTVNNGHGPGQSTKRLSSEGAGPSTGGKSAAKRPSRPPAPKDGAAAAPPPASSGAGAGTAAATVTGKRSDRHGKGSAAGTVVNFDKLRTETLQKYRRHYQLDVSDEATKEKLVHTIASHFTKEKVDESKVLVAFITALASSGQALNCDSD